MKEAVQPEHVEEVLATTRTCNTCTFRKDELEMIAPHVSGTVDFCKVKQEEITTPPKDCEFYKMNLATRISDFFKGLRPVRINPRDVKKLGYPPGHVAKIEDMVNKRDKTGIVVSYIGDDGVAHTEVIYPNSDEK